LTIQLGATAILLLFSGLRRAVLGPVVQRHEVRIAGIQPLALSGVATSENPEFGRVVPYAVEHESRTLAELQLRPAETDRAIR
jgi:hypothetical protein